MAKRISAVNIRTKGKGFEARPWVNGKQLSIYRHTFEEVQDELAKIQLGKRLASISKDITVEEYLTSWLDREELAVRTGDRKYNTYIDRKGKLEKYVVTGLGNLLLRDVSVLNVRAHFDALAREAMRKSGTLTPVGSRSRQIAFEALRSALTSAVDDGYLLSNPLYTPKGRKKGPKPGHKKSKRVFLTADQANALLDSCVKQSRKLYMLCFTALHTGMRSGELRALRRSAIDLEESYINVLGSASEALDGGHDMVYPKSHAGFRKVTISETLVDELTPWLESLNPEDLVFPNAVGGIMNRNGFMERQFRPAVKDSECPEGTDFHSLRHTHVAMLIAANVSPKKIQARLGHASITITMDTYGHLFPSDDKTTASVLDGAFKRPRESQGKNLKKAS